MFASTSARLASTIPEEDLDGAAGSQRKLDPAEGLQDAQLESGARLYIVHGDVAREGHGGPFAGAGEHVDLLQIM